MGGVVAIQEFSSTLPRHLWLQVICRHINKSIGNVLARIDDGTAGQPYIMMVDEDLFGRSAMQVPVLIEPMANNGFRAKAGEPLPVSAVGSTPDEALGNLQEAMKQQLSQGARLVAVDVPAQDNPWLAIAGTHDPNDPLIQKWKQEIAAYRQERDSDPDMP